MNLLQELIHPKAGIISKSPLKIQENQSVNTQHAFMFLICKFLIQLYFS